MLVPSARSPPKYGIASHSIRRPRTARTAGRNVSDPMTEMSTTLMVATAMERKMELSISSSPAREMATARPLKNTARPAVLLATSMAASTERPARRSVRKRLMMNSE